ncbi:MAG: HEAT repeat domain-containing protein, partial [Solirubrobacteraceae bacterium]
MRTSSIASRRNSGGYGGLVRGTSHLLTLVFRPKPSGVLETGGTPIVSLRDEDERVAGAAARALGILRDPRATKPLREAGQHDSEEVRVAAANALENIGRSPRPDRDLHKLRRAARELIEQEVRTTRHATVRFFP